MEKINSIPKKKPLFLKIPPLYKFSEMYFDFGLPNNWHHKVFYYILDNMIYQENGLLHLNVERHFSRRFKTVYIPNPSRKLFNRNILILSPRFHSKSTAITLVYPIYEIYKNPNVRILIISANEEIAKSFNRAIVWQLEYNWKLIEKFGSLEPSFSQKKKWGEKAIIVKRTKGLKDPTVTATGVLGKIISRRADIIIMDDIIDMETARTAGQRKKVLEWFENVVLPVLDANGRVVCVGTTWYKNDIYDKLYNNPHFDIRLKLRALMYSKTFVRKSNGKYDYLPYVPLKTEPLAQEIHTVFGEDVIRHFGIKERVKSGVLWEKKWDYKKLKKKKELVSIASFNRQYMNEPVSEKDRIFSEEKIKHALRRGARMGLIPSWNNDTVEKPRGYEGRYMVVIIGVDLAISEKEGSDYTAITVWGLDGKGNRILLWLERGHWSPDETRTRILDFYYAFNPVKIVVESVGFQDIIRQDLSQEVPIVGFKTNRTNKFDKIVGLAHVAMLFEQDKIILPSNVKFNGQKKNMLIKKFVEEILSYTEDSHTGDMLMASWFALSALNDFDITQSSKGGFIEPRYLAMQQRKAIQPQKVIVTKSNPPKFVKSVVSVLGFFLKDLRKEGTTELNPVDKDKKYFIFATADRSSIAYIFSKNPPAVIGRIYGYISTDLFVDILMRTATLFNNAQIVVDKNGKSASVLMELQRRGYRNVYAGQPDANGNFMYDIGYKINSADLPLIFDYVKEQIINKSVLLRDSLLIKDFGKIISIDEKEIETSAGTPQLVKTFAVGWWLLNQYNLEEEEKDDKKKKTKKKKQKYVPHYRVFNYLT